MKKTVLNRIAAIGIFAAMFAGCTSSRIQNLIMAGDDVGAIEVLAPQLAKKPDSKDLVGYFDSVYPRAVESRIPVKTIEQIRRENLDSYGSSVSAALRSCINEIGPDRSLSEHRAVAAVINQGELSIKKLADLIRIQNAVSVVPAAIGGNKTGYTVIVEKYLENFTAEYNQARKDLGQFYYALAEAAFPGTTIYRKKEIVNCYKKAAEYDSSLSNNKSRIQQLSYEIAMILKQNASTKTELAEVINYFKLAENYKDSANQIIAAKYALAEIYRSEGTVSSYEQAGQLYSECAGYGNAADEARLYDFYRTIKSLSKNSSSSNVNLTSGRYTPMKLTESISDIDEYQSRLSASLKTSDVQVYTSDSENIIYPGAVIAGSSIPQQKFALITSGARKPVDFNLVSGGRNISTATLTNTASPSDSQKKVKANARYQRNYIIPEYTYDFKTVYSADELRLATGLGADGSKVFFIDDRYWKKNRSYTLVTVTQKFYTAELVEPKLSIDLFSGAQRISTAEAGNVTPYYVSSVDYGRKGYFIICSELSSDQIISDIKKYRPRDSSNSGSYTTPNSSLTRRWDLYSTTVDGITVSEKAYRVSNFEGMFYWIQDGVYADFGVDELPPVSCRLKNLVDGSYAVLSSSANSIITNPDPDAAAAREERERRERERIERERKEMEQNVVIRPSASSGSNVRQPTVEEVEALNLPQNITGPGRKPAGSSSSGSSTSASGNTGSAGSGSSGQTSGNAGSAGGSSSSAGTGSSTAGGSSGSSPSSGSTGGSSVNNNGYTSLVFVGKYGTYQCDRITSGDEWIYYIDERDILNCVASWNSSEYSTVYVNGILMTKNSTVYSFRDVIGNNISLDIVDSSGNRKHHLLKILKK